MATWQFPKGLHEIGNSVYAYLQPDGSWGWSNAGLVVDGQRSLLADKPPQLFPTAAPRPSLPATP